MHDDNEKTILEHNPEHHTHQRLRRIIRWAEGQNVDLRFENILDFVGHGPITNQDVAIYISDALNENTPIGFYYGIEGNYDVVLGQYDAD